MFCDQDDIWLQKKIEHGLKKIIAMEAQYPNLPHLVFTDLTVVDKNLKIISDSSIKYQSLNINNINSLTNMLIENIVTGCTILMNKKAKEVSLPISHNAIMHDWWIALKIKKKKWGNYLLR